MILDSLENLEMYATLNPNFPKAIEFIKNTDLAALPTGRNEVCGDLVFANVVEVMPKSKETAQIEIHRKYIDLQIPLTGDEVMGYTPIFSHFHQTIFSSFYFSHFFLKTFNLFVYQSFVNVGSFFNLYFEIFHIHF